MEEKYGEIRDNQAETDSDCQKKVSGFAAKVGEKNAPEVAQLLESDFRKAFKKCYTPEEISSLLKAENIIIPVCLIRQFLPENAAGASRKTAPASRPKPAEEKPQTHAPQSQSFNSCEIKNSRL